MKKRMKKIISASLIDLTLAGAGGSMASAATVYFRGVAVYWNYGRSMGVRSFSTVQTGVFDHSATANHVFSGWQRPGVTAHASAWIGTNRAQCYWNCR